MKRKAKAVLAVMLVCALICGCTAAPPEGQGDLKPQSDQSAAESAASDTESGVSAPEEESVPEMSEVTENSKNEYYADGEDGLLRALVSHGAPYTVSCNTQDENFLTDGLVNELQLDTDGVMFCTASGKSFEITLDLGAVKDDLRLFDLWIVRSSSTADIASMQVFAAGEDKEFSAVCKKTEYAPRAATSMGRLYLLRAESPDGERARYIKFVLEPRSGERAAFAEAAVYSAAADPFAEEITEKAEPAYTRAPGNISVPHVSWSFITTMSLYGASDEMADRYFDTLEEAGITGLIILHGAGQDGGVYPNSALDHIFRRARERGMKVFMGMNPGNDIYNSIDAFLTANKKALTALYQRYYVTYPDVFCGWYMTQEFSNGDFHKYPDETARILNGVLGNVKELNEELPLMLSPYCTSWGGTDKQLKEDLEKILSQVAFREFDIYCPQDGVGCGYFNVENAGDYLSAAAAVCKRHGMRFWVNLENFILDSSLPDGDDDIPAPVSRFIKQIRTAAKYADVLCTFTYEAYMPEFFSNYTIYNDIREYHYNYIHYLNTGKAPVEELPAETEASVKDGVLVLRLPTPTYRVQAVKLNRAGEERWYDHRLLRTCGGATYLAIPDEAPGEPFSVTVYDHSAASTGALRFEGDGAPAQSGGPVERTKPGVNVALGKSYTATAANHSNADSGGELTDGKHGKADFFDAAWQGCNTPTFEVTIDLGELVYNIGDIRVEVLGGGYGAVMEPRSVEVAFSRDGVGFEPAGEVKCTDSGGGSAYIKTEEISFDTAKEARYVKITVSCIGWFFTDEIEVIAYN